MAKKPATSGIRYEDPLSLGLLLAELKKAHRRVETKRNASRRRRRKKVRR